VANTAPILGNGGDKTMIRFSANLTMLFTEVDFPDRFERAAKAGFKAVEYLFPYPWEKGELAERLAKYGLQQALFNLPAGNWAGGERGIACLPGREGEFRDGVTRRRSAGRSSRTCVSPRPPWKRRASACSSSP
jgi:hydroxypyruvate isomerase